MADADFFSDIDDHLLWSYFMTTFYVGSDSFINSWCWPTNV